LFGPCPDDFTGDLNLLLEDRIVRFGVFFLKIETHIQRLSIIIIRSHASDDIMSKCPSFFRIVPIFPGALNARSIWMLKDSIIDNNIPRLAGLNQLIDSIVIQRLSQPSALIQEPI